MKNLEVWLALHPKVKFCLRWAYDTLILFIGIWLILFLGMWKVFEAKDPICLEALAASVLAVLLCIMDELYDKLNGRIHELEKRVEELEAAHK